MPRRFVMWVHCGVAIVAPLSAAAGQRPSEGRAGPVPVMGTVSDSVAGRPLAGAVVQLVPAANPAGTQAYTATADSAGAFTIPGVPPGRYLAGFLHPAVDALGIAPPVRQVDVASDGPTRVRLATPSPARIAAALCGTRPAADSSGAIVGVVHDADDGMPVAGAKLVVTWSELVVEGRPGLRLERRRLVADAGSDGRVRLCGVPSGADVMASVEAPGRRSGIVEAQVPARGLVRRDFLVGRPASATAAGRDRGGQPAFAGEARLRGVVRGPGGRAVRDATVLVWGTAVSGRTGADGTFAMAGLPAGTHSLEVRALGYAPVLTAVDLSSRVPAWASVALERPARALPPVTVYERRGRRPDPTGFLERRRTGAGRYVAAADIERMSPAVVSDALRTLPGVRIVPGVLGASGQVSMRGCEPRVFVDGVPVLNGSRVLDNIVPPGDVLGIEVYPQPGLAPVQYSGGLDNNCTILVWTKR
jgi:hypothetical protein